MAPESPNAISLNYNGSRKRTELATIDRAAPAVGPPFLAKEQGAARYVVTTLTSAKGKASSSGLGPRRIGLIEPISFGKAA